MSTHRDANSALVVLLAAAALLSLVAAAPLASADHGANANYTAIPEERDPGNKDATYTQFAISPQGIEYLDYIRATWKEGGFSGCGPTNSEVFGIDRGNTHSGTQVDEDLTQYVEETTVNEDRFEANFYERDDAFGSSTNLEKGDQFVGFTKNCFDNPDEPGWYQIQSSIGGWNGDTYVEKQTSSHYFWICDCENEQEARKKLGPPPSEQGSGGATATPSDGGGGGDSGTATDSGGSDGGSDGGASAGDGSDGGGSGDGSTTATPSPGDDPTGTPSDDRGPSGTPADGGGSGGGDGGASTGDGSDGSTGAGTQGGGQSGSGQNGSGQSGGGKKGDWDDYVRRTPTDAGGPGFGVTVAVFALLAAALLATRR